MENNTILQTKKHQPLFIELPLKINTYDIDVAGHVNNIVYIRWLEDLRTKLFSNICNFKEVFENGFYLVVISTSINYKKQLKLFDSPMGIMKLDNLKHGVITLNAQIKIGKQIYATAEQKCVIMNLKTSKMIINELILRLINHF